MRLVTYEKDGVKQVGIKAGNQVKPTSYTNLLDLIVDGKAGLEKARAAADQAEPVAAGDCRILPPLTNPGKVLCAGINYKSHKEENAKAVFPENPSFFSKLPTSIIGPDEAIVIPSPESQVDYEVELAFIIGKKAKKVTKQNALGFIFGYTVANDVSGRDLQFNLQHETIGKGADTFCPIGPEVVLTDEIPDPSNLRIASYVNGEVRQSSPTSDMLFDIPTLLAFVTQYITLEPGDILTTGTPAGVGVFRNPQTFLKPGDVVEVEVDAIGKLRNTVKAGW